MNFFDGMEWIAHNRLPDCRVWVDKHFPDYYVLNYAGRGYIHWQRMDGSIVELPAPLAWVCYPGTHFRYGCRDGAAWDQRFVSFRGDRVERYLRTGLFPAREELPYRPVGEGERFASEFDDLFETLENPLASSSRATHLLEGLLLSLSEQPAPVRPGTRIEHDIRRFATRLADDAARAWDFRAEARRLGLSYTHFRRSFKAFIGLPPGQFLIAKRMENASRLLRQGSEPVKAIADRCGYSDLYYFTRVFTARYGLPPGRYRRRAHSP